MIAGDSSTTNRIHRTLATIRIHRTGTFKGSYVATRIGVHRTILECTAPARSCSRFVCLIPLGINFVFEVEGCFFERQIIFSWVSCSAWQATHPHENEKWMLKKKQHLHFAFKNMNLKFDAIVTVPLGNQSETS